MVVWSLEPLMAAKDEAEPTQLHRESGALGSSPGPASHNCNLYGSRAPGLRFFIYEMGDKFLFCYKSVCGGPTGLQG